MLVPYYAVFIFSFLFITLSCEIYLYWYLKNETDFFFCCRVLNIFCFSSGRIICVLLMSEMAIRFVLDNEMWRKVMNVSGMTLWFLSLFHEKLDDPYRNISVNFFPECKGWKTGQRLIYDVVWESNKLYCKPLGSFVSTA